jgi:hypothetical protein
MWRFARRGFCALFVTIISTPASYVWAVDPNPLQDAYWRFEEGASGQPVMPTNEDAVFDSSGNSNHLRATENTAQGINSAPTYTSTVPPKPLKSGATNALALHFTPDDDLHASAKPINNGYLEPGQGFTVEAAFYTFDASRFAAIVAKEGQPGLGRGLGSDENVQTFVLKTREDNSHLQVEQWDAAGNLVQAQSLAPLAEHQWYYVAAVNDGSTLSLWLDSGAGYELQGSVGVSGALYQGTDPENPNWDKTWTVGRGQYAGNATDWFNGYIDEVRLSNSALQPSQFLFAPPSTVIDGDFNEDGKVDAADYVVWRKLNPNDSAAYEIWVNNYGDANAGTGGGNASVPEPTNAMLLGIMVCATALIRRTP